jgi:hypothetical protein
VAGCGSSGNDEEAADLLKRGFATDVQTGELSLEAEVELNGGPMDGPLRVRLDGPFRAAGSPTEMPDLDMDFQASGAGESYDGRVVATRENAWVELRGETYEVGEDLWARALEALASQQEGSETLGEAGIDPLDWVEGAETDGEEDVAGTRTTKVTARLDVGKLVSDINQLSPGGAGRLTAEERAQIEEVIDDFEFEAWIGRDRIWRRLTAETEFEIPEDDRDEFEGLESGRVELEVELDEPNQPVEIEGPAEARPIEELLRQLGIPPELLLGPGFAQPSPG